MWKQAAVGQQEGQDMTYFYPTVALGNILILQSQHPGKWEIVAKRMKLQKVKLQMMEK